MIAVPELISYKVDLEFFAGGGISPGVPPYFSPAGFYNSIRLSSVKIYNINDTYNLLLKRIKTTLTSKTTIKEDISTGKQGHA